MNATHVAGLLNTENTSIAFISDPLNCCLPLNFSHWSKSSTVYCSVMLDVTRHQQEQDTFEIKVQFQEIWAHAQLYGGNFIAAVKCSAFKSCC